MLAVDVLANAIRSNHPKMAASTLAERYLRALHAAGYIVIKREPLEDLVAKITPQNLHPES